VTIVAGFLTQECVLMCADTMYTGNIKIHQSKLFGADLKDSLDSADHCSLTFALAGNEANACMAIEDCIQGIQDCPVAQRGLRAVTKILREAVLNINTQYVDSRPESERYDAQFDLVIGAWLPRGGGLKLFSTSGPGLVRRDGYDCLGSGSYFGHYLIRPIFNGQMSIREVALLATQAIATAKDYDPGCGGDTQFMTISPGGSRSSLIPFDVSSSEGYITEFDRLSRRLLFEIGNGQADETQFDAKLSMFTDEVRRIRAMWNGKGFEFLEQMISKLVSQNTSGQPKKRTKRS
jgi:hypothetical protein